MGAKQISRGKMLRAWNHSAETVSKVDKLVQSVRTHLNTKQVIDTRRISLNISHNIGAALSNEAKPDAAIKNIDQAVTEINQLSLELEKLVHIENMNRDRLSEAIDLLTTLKKMLLEVKADA